MEPVAPIYLCTHCGREFRDTDSDDSERRCPDDNTGLTTLQVDVQSGVVFGKKYAVIGRIGSGASSSTYLAKHQDLGSLLVLKVLHAHHFEEADKVQAFRKEAQRLSQFDHPNLNKAFDQGNTPQPFIAMDYVQGSNLSGYLNRHPAPSQSQIRSMFTQLASALGAIHNGGILHRDIKPSNIIVDDTNEHILVKLIDFGIATAIEEPGAALTESGKRAIMGTPVYSSPEQLSRRYCDARSDIYSLGCVMYEVITGEPPFGRDNFAAIEGHARRQPTPPGERDTPVASPFDQVVLKCLEKEPENRFQNAAALIDAITQVDLQAKPTVSKQRQANAKQPKLALMAGSMLLLTAAISLSALLINQQHRSATHHRQTTAELEEMVNKNPNDAQSQYLLALAYCNKHQVNGSIVQWITRTDNDYANALKQDMEKAEKHFSLATKLAPKNADYFARLGAVQMNLGKPAPAFDNAQQALALDPKYFLGYQVRSKINLESRRLHDAVADFDEAILLNPTNKEGCKAVALILRGSCYLELGDYQRAVDDCMAGLALDPGNVVATRCKTLAYIALHRYKEALAELDREVKTDPAPDLIFIRAHARKQAGDFKGCIEDCDTVIGSRDSGYKWEPYLVRAIARNYSRQPELALTETEKYSYVPNIRAVRAVSCNLLGKYNEAIAESTSLLKASPGTPTPYRLRGVAYTQLGQYAKARADFRKALALAPHSKVLPEILSALPLSASAPLTKSNKEKLANALSRANAYDWKFTVGIE